MIRYRKGGSVRIGRFDAPEPPFNAAISVEPYSFPRSVPLAFDYIRLIATAVGRAEVQIGPAEVEVDRISGGGPVLIDSTGPAELVYRRGESLHHLLMERSEDRIIQLISTDGWVPEVRITDGDGVVLCAWPPDLKVIASLGSVLAKRGSFWGVAVPIAFPVTTDLGLLRELADLAAEHSAAFLTAVRFDLDPSARRALAAMTPTDDETYSTLFDEGEEAISIATERHVAHLAGERRLQDAVLDSSEQRTNWAAASRIATAGYRLLQMAQDVELAWEFVRSARLLATLDKPLRQIASVANLGIIEGLPPQITDALEQWLETGEAELFESIDRRWRLPRDYGT